MRSSTISQSLHFGGQINILDGTPLPWAFQKKKRNKRLRVMSLTHRPRPSLFDRHRVRNGYNVWAPTLCKNPLSYIVNHFSKPFKSNVATNGNTTAWWYWLYRPPTIILQMVATTPHEHTARIYAGVSLLGCQCYTTENDTKKSNSSGVSGVMSAWIFKLRVEAFCLTQPIGGVLVLNNSAGH